MAWWRAYDEAADDPKLQRLSGDLFKSWFNLLCLASRNGGLLPPIDDIAFGLRKSNKEAQKTLDALIEAKLFDVSETGIEPHNWNGRQYKTDVSTERVRAFRERKRKRPLKRDETVSRNAPEQSRAEQSRGAPLQGAPCLAASTPTSATARAEERLGAQHARDTSKLIGSLAGKLRVEP